MILSAFRLSPPIVCIAPSTWCAGVFSKTQAPGAHTFGNAWTNCYTRHAGGIPDFDVYAGRPAAITRGSTTGRPMTLRGESGVGFAELPALRAAACPDGATPSTTTSRFDFALSPTPLPTPLPSPFPTTFPVHSPTPFPLTSTLQHPTSSPTDYCRRRVTFRPPAPCTRRPAPLPHPPIDLPPPPIRHRDLKPTTSDVPFPCPPLPHSTIYFRQPPPSLPRLRWLLFPLALAPCSTT